MSSLSRQSARVEWKEVAASSEASATTARSSGPQAGEDLLLKTDQLIESVHFPKTMRPEMIGERALARALSDIAAAGGDPRCCLVALAVPRTKSERWVLAFFADYCD